MCLFQKHFPYKSFYNSQRYQIIIWATKCYKLNCSIPLIVRLNIGQSMPLTSQVTFIMGKRKKYQEQSKDDSFPGGQFFIKG